MAGRIDSTGDIEIFCHPMGSGSRGSVPFFDAIGPGDRLGLVFGPNEGSNPPYTLKVYSPSGTLILDTIVRELPTGEPQSPPPIEFIVSATGIYRIQIRESRGRQSGEAKVRVG